MSASSTECASGLTWSTITRLIRLPNQTGTWLLMLPTLWALVLSSRGIPPWRLVVIFMVGSFVMRSAGVVLNDLVDRSFDRQVARTRHRPLASGELQPPHALAVVAVLLTIAALLVLQLNALTIMLSPVAIVLAALYPFAKRIVHLPQAVLGIAFGWGTIMAWTASHGTIESTAWLTFAATVCWALAYDTIYALQDRDDDRLVGIKSSALYFGSRTWLAVGITCAAMLFLLGIASQMVGIGGITYAVLTAVGLFFAKQVNELRTPVSPARAFELFHQHVWIGTVILGGLLLGFLW
ncbi:MAG TPA: 4-hydroxybenzoate octaprenyltransferase [Nitrospira sp.]|nr:4-hydroxybenzoate octaprenyltransferase [Nitrospira sp.]